MIEELKASGYPDAAIIGSFFDIPREGGSELDTTFMISTQEAVSMSMPIRDDDIGSCPVDDSEFLIWLD